MYVVARVTCHIHHVLRVIVQVIRNIWPNNRVLREIKTNIACGNETQETLSLARVAMLFQRDSLRFITFFIETIIFRNLQNSNR